MVGAFIADLCWLAKHCEFGVYLDEVFTDLFMCGLNSNVMHIQVKLSFQSLAKTDKVSDNSLQIMDEISVYSVS